MKEILILTEASKKIGLGHLNRCINLLSIFDNEDEFSFKVCVRGGDNTLKIDHSLIFKEWSDELVLENLLSTVSLVIVDCYLVDKKILDFISLKAVRSLFIIDNKKCYGEGGTESFILFSSPYGKAEDFPESLHVFAGIDFLLFKRELFKAKVSLDVTDVVQKIVINLGGYFDKNLIEKIITVIDVHYSNISITVLGKPKEGKIDEKNYSNQVTSKFLTQDEYVAELNSADLVICNGGQSLNEALFLNKNCIVIAIAENQSLNIHFWNDKKVIKFVGSTESPNLLLKLKTALKEFDLKTERENFLPLKKVSFNKNIKDILFKEIFRSYEE